MFDHIINWKLKSGSHDFPGPDGGTCINEAAIVAAGFEYKAIRSAHDCPPCFSRPIAAYAIRLNDNMPDAIRNELLIPFVTRLAGTADSPDVERARVHHMATRGVNLILPIVLRAAKREAEAIECEAVTTLNEARRVAASVSKLRAAATYADASAAYAAATYADADAAYAAADAAADVYADAAADAVAAASTAAARLQVWLASVQILDEAIKLGNQGDAIAVDVAVGRLNAAMALAS